MTEPTKELVDRLWLIAADQWRFDDHRQLDAWRVMIPMEVKAEPDFSIALDEQSAVIHTVEFRREFGNWSVVNATGSGTGDADRESGSHHLPAIAGMEADLYDMSNPTCPKCKSSNVSFGYPLDAGTDKCNACGYAGPVTEFHQLTDWKNVVAEFDKFAAIPPNVKHGLKTMADDINRLPLKKYEPKTPTIDIETHGKFWWQDK